MSEDRLQHSSSTAREDIVADADLAPRDDQAADLAGGRDRAVAAERARESRTEKKQDARRAVRK